MIKVCPNCKREFEKLNKPKQISCSRSCRTAIIRRTHGFSGTHFYRVWLRIKRVCNDKKFDKYKFYGGRGIKCLWKSFEEFRDNMYESYKKSLELHGKLNTTIERINNNGNYCVNNCRLATAKEQVANSRKRAKK